MDSTQLRPNSLLESGWVDMYITYYFKKYMGIESEIIWRTQ